MRQVAYNVSFGKHRTLTKRLSNERRLHLQQTSVYKKWNFCVCVCGRQVGGMADFINSSCDLCMFLIRGLNKTFFGCKIVIFCLIH